MQCPCHSGKFYSDCCEPYHKSIAIPSTPVALMRSRYSAYALKRPEYIMQTTHPFHADFHLNRDLWRQQIIEFSQNTSFDDLYIKQSRIGSKTATVSFRAQLSQHGQDVSYTEESIFENVEGRWLYRAARILD